MPRRFVETLLLLMPVACLTAQAPRSTTIVGVVRDHASAEPVADAEVSCQPAPWPDYPALRGLRAMPAATQVRSDARGMFRIPDVEGSASLLLRTERGLGAFVGCARPGRALRVDLLPMAELTAGEADPEFVLYAAWLGERGERHPLPSFAGRAVRLPAGAYEVWCRTSAGWRWSRVDLPSGQRVALPPAGPAQKLVRQGAVRVTPADWPHVALLDHGLEDCCLCGAAARATLATQWLVDGRFEERDVPAPAHGAADGPVPWPGPAVAHDHGDGSGPPGRGRLGVPAAADRARCLPHGRARPGVVRRRAAPAGARRWRPRAARPRRRRGPGWVRMGRSRRRRAGDPGRR
jgi:hypothetical protein